jgi:hypothetical protein
MANPILVPGAAGRVGAVGRTVTELLLKQGKAVRAMVRNELSNVSCATDRELPSDRKCHRKHTVDRLNPQPADFATSPANSQPTRRPISPINPSSRL